MSETVGPPSEPQVRESGFSSVTGVDIGLLIIRVGIGVIFFGHGLQKLGWFEGGGYPHDMASQEQFLTFFGYSSTSLLSWVLTLTEVACGLSLLLGAVLPLGAAGAAGIMLQAVVGYQWDGGLFGTNDGVGGFEFALMFMVAAVGLGFTGPGRLSVDGALGWRLSGTRWGLAALVVAVVVGLIVLIGFGVGLGGTPAPPVGP